MGSFLVQAHIQTCSFESTVYGTSLHIVLLTTVQGTQCLPAHLCFTEVWMKEDIHIKLTFSDGVWGCGKYLYGSGQRPVAGCGDHGMEHQWSLKDSLICWLSGRLLALQDAFRFVHLLRSFKALCLMVTMYTDRMYAVRYNCSNLTL